jgi:chromosomal replication initiator protein
MTPYSAPGILNAFPMTIEYITKKVFANRGVSLSMLDSKTRKREIVLARQIAMYFSKNLVIPTPSLSTIGGQIGNKDHATVLHACKTIHNLITTDKYFRLQIDKLECILKQNNISAIVD